MMELTVQDRDRLARAYTDLRDVLDRTNDKPVPIVRDRPVWETLRAPVIDDAEWNAPKDYTVKDLTGLRDAIAKSIAAGGGVIEIEPGEYQGIKVNTGKEWAKPEWGWNGLAERIVLRGKGEVIIQGIARQYGYGELWCDNLGLQCGPGGSSAIGSPGQVGAWRLRNSRLLKPPYQADAFGGNGTKWGARMYGGLLHMIDCDWTAPCQEHGIYDDNMAGVILVRTKLGPGGRTHIQTGSRQQFPAPHAWYGILIEDCSGEGLNSGAGGGSGITIYGYDGPVMIRRFRLASRSQGNMAGNRALSVWRPVNYGGTIPTNPDQYATDRVTIHGFDVEYPGMDRPAFEIESCRILYLGDCQGNVPAGKWRLDAPDQWPSGPLGKIEKIAGSDQHGLIIPSILAK